MKKLIPLMLIIFLLLPSCQLKKPQIIESPTLATVSETITEFVSQEASQSSAVSSTEAVSVPSSTLTTAISVFNPNTTTSEAVTTTKRVTTTQIITTTKKPTTTKQVTTIKAPEKDNELRGIWISCYDHISAAGKSKNEYASAVEKMFQNIKNCGFNTAFIHLRAFSDAFYKSEIYPYSAFIAGKEGATLSFDPFEVILEKAAKYSISVHGWINPFRVSTKKDVSLLSNSNPAKKLLDSGNENGEICILSNGIYYNPSLTSNHKLIYDGVREIIEKYDIDGIHIDDYFYPSTDETIDKKQYSEYKASGGALTLSKWREACVNAFVSGLYSAVKSADESLTVSISPSAKLEENKNNLYADCELWLSHKGYADMIIPQIYYGFEHQTLGFQATLNKWGNLSRASGIQLVCGIAAYKCATTDSYAGTGSAEWKNNTDILVRQVAAIRKNSNYCGYVVFSYKDLLRTDCKTEIQNLKNAVN